MKPYIAAAAFALFASTAVAFAQYYDPSSEAEMDRLRAQMDQQLQEQRRQLEELQMQQQQQQFMPQPQMPFGPPPISPSLRLYGH